MKSLLAAMKNYLCLAGTTVLVLACSSTPNNVSISLNQGQCVPSSNASIYNNSSIIGSPQYYNVVANNPSTTTPYCMAVTIQNNNSGTNANNIQITSNGLQVTYTPVSPANSTSTTVTMMDNYAANNGNTYTQQVNNVVLFDPNNCDTIQGQYVKSLSTQGGSCTFYFEILNESSPVGVYSYGLSYNYTNGNQNFSVSTNINQRVNLYGGAGNGLYYMNTNVATAATNPTTTVPVWQTGINGAPTTSVPYVIEGPYGYVLFFTYTIPQGQTYGYNGNTVVPIGGSLPGQSALALDESGNIYASTSSNGMYVYNASTESWTQIVDTSGSNYVTASSNIIGLRGAEYTSQPNTIFVIESNIVYGCTPTNASTPSLYCLPAGNVPPAPPISDQPSLFTSNPNASDVSPAGQLFAGSINSSGTDMGASVYLSSSWFFFDNLPELPTTFGASIGGVNWSTANGTLYFGLVGFSQEESSVFSCSISNGQCTPLMSAESNIVSGNVPAVTTDSLGDLYIAGSVINSIDFESSLATNVTGAFLLNESVGPATWTAIEESSSLGTSSPIQSIVAASMLTTY